MKMQKLSFANQHGFTLLESLVALVIFAIIVLGSSAAIKHMFNNQKDMNMSFIVVNEMQKRLQNAQDKSDIANICDRISTSPLTVNSEFTYYFGCSTQSLTVNGVDIQWPILAASSQSVTIANNCAADTLHSSCYVVGK